MDEHNRPEDDGRTAGLEAGIYTLSIVTKPGNTYFTAKIDSEIKIA